MLSYIVAILVAISTPTTPGTQVCWANSLNDPSEGTYGWSNSRPLAAEAALDLCEQEFGPCSLEYCEGLSNRRR